MPAREMTREEALRHLQSIPPYRRAIAQFCLKYWPIVIEERLRAQSLTGSGPARGGSDERLIREVRDRSK